MQGFGVGVARNRSRCHERRKLVAECLAARLASFGILTDGLDHDSQDDEQGPETGESHSSDVLVKG